MTKYLLIVLCCGILLSCATREGTEEEEYTATPLELEVPELFQQLILPPVIPADNPMSVEGVALGRKLFYETRLSGDNTLSCAGCHAPQSSFSDNRQFSIGIDGLPGNRNSMPLFNLAFNYNELFFWDGRAPSLEDQIFNPVTNPVEMHNTWQNVEATLQADGEYPELFEAAFGTQNIDSTLVTKAIAQFVRTMISGNSKFDRYLMGTEDLTPQELNGLNVFLDENRGDCFHCHGNPNSPLWTDNIFHNNGLDETFSDRGRGGVTGDPREFGQFRTPSLRNLSFTAPYMHDGRFETIEEVINHYSEGLVYSETIDPLMKSVDQGGVQLSEEDKADLLAFLKTLDDPSFLTDPDFQDPN